MASIFEELAAQKSENGSSIFEELAMQKPSKSKKEGFEKAATDVIQQGGRKFLSSALGSPRLFAEFLKSGSEYLAEKGAGEGGEIDPFTQKVLTGLGLPESLLNKIGYPDQEGFEEMIMKLGEATGAKQLSEEPQTGAGRRAAKVGEFAGTAALGGPKSLAERLLFGGIGGLGAAEAEERGTGAGGQIGAAFALPALVQAIASIKTGKFKPNTQELEDLAKFARSQGLTEAEIVPLLQSQGKQKALGKLAKGDTKIAETLSSAEGKLGNAFERLKEQSRDLPPATRKQTKNLINDFDGVSENLKLSKLPPNDKVEAIKKIEEAINNVAGTGINPEEIISTWQDINSTVNWNAYKGGKKDLAKLKKPLQSLYEEISPEGAASFGKINDLWGRLKSIEKNIGPNNFKSLTSYGKGIIYLGKIVNNLAAGDIDGLIKSGSTILGVELSQNLAKKMLTDPKYQNLGIKAAQAIKNGSRPQILKAYEELNSKVVEDFPEESKKVDWNSLVNKPTNEKRS